MGKCVPSATINVFILEPCSHCHCCSDIVAAGSEFPPTNKLITNKPGASEMESFINQKLRTRPTGFYDTKHELAFDGLIH